MNNATKSAVPTSLLVLFVILLTVCLCAVTYSVGSKAPPGVFEIEPTIRMGELEGGKEVGGVVHIRNNTDREVLIDPIRTSCGCLTSGHAVRIPPRADVEFSFNFHTPASFGNFRHEILFTTGNATHTTTIMGKVVTVGAGNVAAQH